VEKWEQEKRRQPLSILQILSTASIPLAHRNILHHNLVIPNASQSQLKLLHIRIRIFVETLLTNHCKVLVAQTELQKYWGTLPKYTLPFTIAYTDGSASQTQNKAGFDVFFPELEAHMPLRTISACIPGCQTIARAEGFGVLAALLLSRQTTNLTIHCDRQSLVDIVNKYRDRTPATHELSHIKDRSLVLRIIEEIKIRPGSTNIVHIKAHQRDHESRLERPLSNEEIHQEHNKMADKIAKAGLDQSSIFIPEERTWLPQVSIILDHFQDGEHIYENNPLKLYQLTYKKNSQNYHYKGNWHKYLFHNTIWQEPSFSILHNKKESKSLQKFLVKFLEELCQHSTAFIKFQPRLYSCSNCILCGQASDETIEHLFFHCAETASRRSLLEDQCMQVICEQHAALNTHETLQVLRDSLLNIPDQCLKFWSSGQLPKALKTWLLHNNLSKKMALRIGKKFTQENNCSL
jgi:ribonuclease HI